MNTRNFIAGNQPQNCSRQQSISFNVIIHHAWDILRPYFGSLFLLSLFFPSSSIHQGVVNRIPSFSTSPRQLKTAKSTEKSYPCLYLGPVQLYATHMVSVGRLLGASVYNGQINQILKAYWELDEMWVELAHGRQMLNLEIGRFMHFSHFSMPSPLSPGKSFTPRYHK